MNIVWEEGASTAYTDTYRLAVPGGWLYRVERRTVNENGFATTFAAMTVTFVPSTTEHASATPNAPTFMCVCGHRASAHDRHEGRCLARGNHGMWINIPVIDTSASCDCQVFREKT